MSFDDDYPVEMNAFAKDDELIEQVALGRHRRGADGDPLVGALDELRALRSAPAPAMSEALTAALLSNTWDMRTEEDTTAAVAAARTRKGVPGYLPYAIGAAAAAVVFAFAGGGLPSKRNSYVASDLPSATTSPAPHEPTAEPTPAPTPAPTTAPEARQGGSRSVTYTAPTSSGSSTPTSTKTPTPAPTPAPPEPTTEPPAPAPETTSPTLLDGLTTTVASVLSIPGKLLLG